MQVIGHPLSDFALPSLDGATVRFSEVLGGRWGGLVLFWSGVCSHCVRYDTYLNQLTTEYPGLALLVVASRQGESLEQLRATAERRSLRFPLLHDGAQRVARTWLVQQTPRAFLVDPQRRLLYRGAIDNFKYAGDREYAPYLEDAIAALRAGRPVARPETPGFGCPIESVYYTLPKPLTTSGRSG